MVYSFLQHKAVRPAQLGMHCRHCLSPRTMQQPRVEVVCELALSALMCVAPGPPSAQKPLSCSCACAQVNSGFFYSNAEQREQLVAAERAVTDDRVRRVIQLKQEVCLGLELCSLCASPQYSRICGAVFGDQLAPQAVPRNAYVPLPGDKARIWLKGGLLAHCTQAWSRL